jgi:seryl-tRNA synthetase
MLDIKFVRSSAELVRKSLQDRGMEEDVDVLLELDNQRRRLLSEGEALRHRKNITSIQIGELIRRGEDPKARIREMKATTLRVKEIDSRIAEVEDKLSGLMLTIPNIPHPSVPFGPGSSANRVVKNWGKIPAFDFKPWTHLEIAQGLDILDFPRASKIVGSNFPLYKGQGARLERALINFMVDLHTKKHGYTEISPPFIVNRSSMTATGQLPKLEEDMYRLKDDDYFLIPTAEVPVTNIHQNEIFEEDDLPICYTAYTPCFRREAGSYGKGTKGLTRVHQFDKVELVKFVRPQDSYEELEGLLADAEEVMQLLEIPYRVSLLGTGDLSFAASICYDIEGWAPGAGAYLEISSCSNFEDFQARRANIRYREKGSRKLAFVHTLNGSGVALARTVVALLENYQQRDGGVVIPAALRPYMDGKERITKY